MRAPAIPIPRSASVATPLGTAALAGLVCAGVLICLRAAAAPSGLIPASWHGMPDWMRGPLPGVGEGLAHGAFAVLFVAMCGCYLGVLATAAALDRRTTVAAIVALHATFLLAPPLL